MEEILNGESTSLSTQPSIKPGIFYQVGLVTKGKMAFQKFTKVNVY